MKLNEFRDHLYEWGVKIQKDYPVESSHCFVCEDLILFFYEEEKDIAVSFHNIISPKKTSFYMFCFQEVFNKLQSVTVMDSHIRKGEEIIFIEEDKIEMGENREKISQYTNILLNEKGYSC